MARLESGPQVEADGRAGTCACGPGVRRPRGGRAARPPTDRRQQPVPRRVVLDLVDAVAVAVVAVQHRRVRVRQSGVLARLLRSHERGELRQRRKGVGGAFAAHRRPSSAGSQASRSTPLIGGGWFSTAWVASGTGGAGTVCCAATVAGRGAATTLVAVVAWVCGPASAQPPPRRRPATRLATSAARAGRPQGEGSPTRWPSVGVRAARIRLPDASTVSGGARMSRVAAIDCGTNSIRLLDRRRHTSSTARSPCATCTASNGSYGSARASTHRGAGSGGDRAHAGRARRLHRGCCGASGAERVRMVATCATRDAANREDFFGMVRATPRRRGRGDHRRQGGAALVHRGGR